jgi:hypothetical protein
VQGSATHATKESQMIGRRAAAGLSLLCALCFCALAAQPASAQIGTKAKNTTAFTCVNLGPKEGDFKDAHCDEKVAPKTGEFAHELIPLNTTTELTVTNNETANKTEAAASITFRLVIAGVKVEITCKRASSEGTPNPSTIHNVESAEKAHTVTGTLEMFIEECVVLKPAQCVVKEPIVLKALFEGVEALGPLKNTHGIEFKADPGKEEKTPLASVSLANKGAEKCALNGIAVEIFGTMIATGTPNASEKHSGATTVFEPGNEMQTLTAGGKPAEFVATFTTRMFGKGNPISFTTVT